MKQIEFDGQIHQFPDDFTDADIAKALGSQKNQPASQPTRPKSASPYDLLPWLRQYHQQTQDIANQDPVHSFLNNYTPSLPTALSILTPGSGLLGALLRMGATGTAQAGETALSGQGNPLRSGLIGAVEQGLGEGATAIAKPAVSATINYGIPMVSRNIQAARIARGLANKAVGPPAIGTPAPETDWLKFIKGEGTPASKILNAQGQPAIPAQPAVSIPHPTLPGWEGADIVSPLTKASQSGGPMGWPRAIGRGVTAYGQEGIEQGQLPLKDKAQALFQYLYENAR